MRSLRVFNRQVLLAGAPTPVLLGRRGFRSPIAARTVNGPERQASTQDTLRGTYSCEVGSCGD